MGKLTRYIFIMSGLMILFYFSGLIQSTPNSNLLNILLSPEDLQNSTLASKLIAALEVIGGIGAVIFGFISKNTELAASTIFTGYLFNLGWDFLAVVSVVASANKILALLIFSPILIVYILTAFEFWRGTDQ